MPGPRPMPVDVTSAATAPSEILPFLWLGGFAACFALHLVLHPLAIFFRDALRWLGKHPGPLLWLMASLMVSKAWAVRSGALPHAMDLMPAATPWPDAFIVCLDEAWKRLAMVFHQAIMPPPLWSSTWYGAILQSLISATGQMWLACYVVTSVRSDAPEDPLALKQTQARWRTLLCLALCHFPWWWVQSHDHLATVRDWLLPEFLIFLAPLPLVAAAERVDFMEAGRVTLTWWRHSWGRMLLFCLTALPLLVLLEYCLRLLPGMLPASQMLARVLLESVLASAVQLWLFVSAALLLLRGGYLSPTTSDD